MAQYRVLVVEDDEQVRELVATLLTDAGLTVMTAATGEEALELLERDEFALMVTDIVLSGRLDGISTVKKARARHPSLKSLFISGRIRPAQTDLKQDDFVSKPFLAHELVGCVWELLFRTRPRNNLAAIG
jgi:DNA-binding response OmpR family regulator